MDLHFALPSWKVSSLSLLLYALPGHALVCAHSSEVGAGPFAPVACTWSVVLIANGGLPPPSVGRVPI